MKKVTKYQERFQPLFEMANLTPENTGFDSGIVYISTKQGNHGPRLKFYRKLGSSLPNAGISLLNPHKIFYDDLGLTKREQEQIVEFITLNQKELLNFWKHGNDWSQKETALFYDNLKKISKKVNAKKLL